MQINKRGRAKEGKRLVTSKLVERKDQHGKAYLEPKKQVMRLYKCIPKGTSRPKQLCIECFKKNKITHIHKNDANYELKICKACELD